MIFQRDLFKLCDKDKPFLGIAIEHDTLNESPNKEWLINAYGEAIQQAIKNKHIICVGTVWGTAEEFRKYSDIMAERLLSEWSERVHPIEQAVGNYIIYYEKLFADVIMPSTNYDGYVMTVGFIPPSELKMDSSSFILNSKGEIAAVVHQYDRNPATTKSVLKRYSKGMSFSTRFKLWHDKDFIGRVIRFIDKVKRKGLAVSLIEAVKRRIH